MRLRTTCVPIVLIIISLSGVAVASDDTMVITYRSGKVQNVAMDEPSAEVQNIGYLKMAVPPPESKTKTKLNKQTGAIEGVRKEQSPDSKKHGVNIEWAPPIDQ